MEQQNKDAPAIVRRRRKVARQQREQTPEASGIKYSDEDSSDRSISVTIKIPPSPPIRQQLPPPRQRTLSPPGERPPRQRTLSPSSNNQYQPPSSPRHFPSSSSSPSTKLPSTKQQQQQQPQQVTLPLKSDKMKNEQNQETLLPKSSTIDRKKSESMSKTISGHLSKILSRRDKNLKASNVRSLSTPREEIKSGRSEIFALMRQAKRSLSSPRHKEESSDSERASPVTVPYYIKERNNSITISDPNEPSKKPMTPFERNIQRFEEERRRFELDKKRFEHEKRELDLMRKRRVEEFDKKRILSLNTYTHSHPMNGHSNIIAPSNDEEKLALIQSFEVAQKISLHKGSVSSGETSKPSDYESSTASCTSSDESEDYPSSTQSDAITFTDKNSTSESPETIHELLKENNIENELDKVKIELDKVENVELPKIVESEIIISEDKQQQDKQADEVTDHNIESKIDLPSIELPLPIEQNGTKKEIVVEKIIDKKDNEKKKKITPNVQRKASFTKTAMIESKSIWKQFKIDHPRELQTIRYLWNKCFANLIILTIYCGFGGMIFRFTEGAFENIYKCGVKRVKRDFVDQLWLSSHNLREDDWKSLARLRLRKFEEELHIANEAGVTSYSGQKAWTFLNGVIYCMTVVTTIGYGHIAPKTATGQAVTIVYAIIGIPLFLILLADFGKLLTRCIKFVWAFVRRLYYTGSCRKVRKTAQVQEMMRGLNVMYDYATFRRPSMIAREAELNLEAGERRPSMEVKAIAPIASPNLTLSPTNTISPSNTLGTNLVVPTSPIGSDTPTTPAPEVFEIDDEFNLPISVAFVVLVIYIFVGATIYTIWEDWTFFESFYFVFISMSTIGFGDYVPNHPVYMMGSILYLIFGLALTSMCINVVQVKLSDHFRQASAKIGATIGLKMAEEEAAKNSQTQTPVELASVHTGIPPTININSSDNNKQFEFGLPPTGITTGMPNNDNNNINDKDKKESKKDKKEKKDKKKDKK